jgi:hypothetical protein
MIYSWVLLCPITTPFPAVQYSTPIAAPAAVEQAALQAQELRIAVPGDDATQVTVDKGGLLPGVGTAASLEPRGAHPGTASQRTSSMVIDIGVSSSRKNL